MTMLSPEADPEALAPRDELSIGVPPLLTGKPLVVIFGAGLAVTLGLAPLFGAGALFALAVAFVVAFAVTSVPDARKGERLAVVHTTDPAKLGEVLAKLATMGLPNLYLPRRQDFVKVDALPLLGTGKLDLRAVRRIAEEALAKDEPAEIASGVDVAERD